MKKFFLWLFMSIIWFIGFSSAWYFSFSSTDRNWYYKHNFYSYWANTLYQIYGCNVPANCVYSVYIHTGNDYKRYVYTSDQLNSAANWNNYINIIGSSCNTRINCSNNAQEFLNYTLAPACPDTLYISQGWETSSYSLSWSSNTLYLDPALTFSTWFDDWYQFYVSAPVCETWSVGDNWSALYINWIQHESASLIDINIADWITWDYTIDEDTFDLDIWSWYDQAYIDWVVDVQSYRPTSEDFTQTFVWGLILFTPYVVILVFVILVWRLLQRIFKTK